MELLSRWKGLKLDHNNTIVSASYIGCFKSGQWYSRVIIIKFASWEVKATILAAYRKQSSVLVEGSELVIFSDLSILTFKKKRNLRFLTSDLQSWKVL